MKKRILYSLIVLMSVVSCVDMDRTPKNIWTDDDLLSTNAGVKVYLARLYAQMPWEDFKYGRMGIQPFILARSPRH